MKEDMYSYHYYLHRAVVKPNRTGSYVFQGVMICAALFLAATAFHMMR